MFKSIAPLFILFFFLFACNNEAKTEKKDTDTTVTTTNSNDTIPVTKSDAVPDENGCVVANGERWSMIKKSCINLSDAVKVDAKDPKLDPTKAAYLVFDSVKVEIMLPTQAKGVVIRKSTAEGEAIWENGPLKLTLGDGMYTLYDEGKILYQGMAVR